MGAAPPRCGTPEKSAIALATGRSARLRSEEHTSELRHTVISYAVFCLKKKKKNQHKTQEHCHKLNSTKRHQRAPHTDKIQKSSTALPSKDQRLWPHPHITRTDHGSKYYG